MGSRRCRSFERVVEDMILDEFGAVEPISRHCWWTRRGTEIELTQSAVRAQRWRAWVVVGSTSWSTHYRPVTAPTLSALFDVIKEMLDE